MTGYIAVCFLISVENRLIRISAAPQFITVNWFLLNSIKHIKKFALKYISKFNFQEKPVWMDDFFNMCSHL